MSAPTITPSTSGSPNTPNFFLQAFCINVEFVESRDFIQQPVDGQCERQKTLAERLRDRDAVEMIVFLKLIGRQGLP
jgi:hypothetical protein